MRLISPMARRCRWGIVGAVAALAFATGCAPSALVVDTAFPPDAERFALLLESTAGTLLFSTPIRAVPAEGPTRVEDIDPPLEEDGTLFVLGWRSADLAGLALGETPVRRAQPGEPTLPTPGFVVRGALGDAPLVPTPVVVGEIPALTSDGVLSCPSRVPSGALVDTSCSANGCVAALAQTGCVLDLDLQGCALGTARGRVDSSGSAHLDDNGALGACAEAATLEGTELSLSCEVGRTDHCRVDVIRPAVAVAPFGTVDRVALVTATATAPSRPSAVMPGYVGALVGLDDRVLVVTTLRPTSVWCTGTFGTMHVVDADTLAVRSSTTTYPCISAMVRDPFGDGVLAAYGGPASARIGRFDRDARLLESAPLSTGGRSVSRLAVGATGRLFVALSTREEDVAELVALGALGFNELWRRRSGAEQYVDVMAFDDEVVALDAGTAQVYAYDFEGSFRLAGPLSLACGIQGVDPVRIAPFRQPNRWVVTALNGGAEVLVLTDTRDTGCDSAATFMAPGAQPGPLAPWPGSTDPERLMVGLALASGEAAVVRYDARTTRFVPGLVLVGRGWVGELAAVGTAAFATLPQTGELVRLRPQ